MPLSRRGIFFLCIAAFGILLFAGIHFDVFSKKVPQDSCFSSDNIRKCLREKAHYIAMSGDIAAAITYTSDVVAPYNRNTAHFAMHMVGMQAYDRLGSRSDAMALLPPSAQTYENVLTYEGYQHGLLMEYFKVKKDDVPIMDLIHESCSDHWVPENPQTVDFSWTANKQCFHAVGHGLMYAFGNDVPKALSVCTQLPYEWMKSRCAYGALMEESYRYNPDYIAAIGGKALVGKGMQSLCNSLAIFADECALFVGRSYFSGHRGDFAGAFTTCLGLKTSAESKMCREQIATIYVTDSGTDFEAMHERCKTAGVFESECLSNVAAAIKHGYAGEAARQKDFCVTLSPDLALRCNALQTPY